MKNVVEEALNGKKTTQQKNDKNSTQSPNQKTSDLNALNQLVRPNHQNKNSEKRLSMLNNQLNQQKTNEKTTQTQATGVLKQTKSSLEDSISELKKVYFSNGKSEKVEARIDSGQGLGNARLIGSTQDGSSIWFFPSVHPNLTHLFQRTTTGYSVAVVNSKVCYPSQLLLLNDLLKMYPDLKYHLTWNKAKSEPFTLELYDTNESRLEKIAKDTFLHISKRSLASVETLQLNSPSAWVLKQLGIMKHVESIGLVEGLTFFNNLLLLDQFYKNEQNPDLSIQLEQQYLVITGKTEAITETLSILKKLGDRI